MKKWIGNTLDRYEITQYLGEGDFGAVFKSYDSVLQRDVALRVMRPEFAQDSNLRDRFLIIARTVAQLDHPGIVQVHDFGQDKGALYLVMEYVPGVNLDHLLQTLEGQNYWIRLREAIGIVRQVSLALDYARSKGVFHFDIRPHNLILQPVSGTMLENTAGLPYQVVIADLALARLPTPEASDEQTRSLYTPPEQIQRQKVNERSDVFSLGMLLYELCVGKLDYSHDTLPSPRSIWEQLPKSINDIIQKCIQTNPSDRYASANELAKDLDEAIPHVTDFRGSPPGVIQTVFLEDYIHVQDQEETKTPEEPSQIIPEEQDYQKESRALSPDKVEVFVETIHASVKPGNQVEVKYSIRNYGEQTRQYNIHVEKIPKDWIPSSPPRIQLPGGQSRDLTLIIHPPKSPHTSPGRYPVLIRVYSQGEPEISDQAEVILTVGVYTQFSSTLMPNRVMGHQSLRVSVKNKGNARETFTLYLNDQSGNLVFHPSQERLILEAGQEQSVVFQTALRSRPIFGGEQEYHFTANIHSTQGERESHQGTAVHTGFFPIAVIPISLITLLCVGLAAVFIYIRSTSSLTIPDQTATAQAQAAATTQAALALVNDATIQAATATTAWSLADDDRDGLTNGDELLYGSDPNVIDSDGDTLPDGVEVHQLECASPVNPDTDGDGLNDNVDPDLCNRYTATPFPTQTPVPPTPTQVLPTDTPIIATATEPSPAVTPTPIGDNGVIAFSSNRDGNFEIYLMVSNGSLQTRISNNPAEDTDPVLSPSREQIAFESNRDGNRQIYVMNSDGSNVVRLSNNGFDDYSPAWSPDGSRLAFISTRDGNPEIYVMNADGSQPVRLLETAAAEDNPSWSPDGGKIIFDSDQNGSREIYTLTIDGTGLLQITDNGATNYDPTFSGSGYRIAFVSNVDGKYDIHIMNADGSGRARLTDLQAAAYEPDWSQDELWLAFETRVQDTGDIYIINADGSQLTNLTNNPADDTAPSW